MSPRRCRGDDWALLVGRLMFVALFLPAGVGKLAQFAGTAGFIGSKGLPLPVLLTGATVALEIGASLGLLLGWRTRWAAVALFGFTLLAGIVFHDFWASAPEAALGQRQAFFKNIGIAAGLLVLAVVGAGRLSLDHRRENPDNVPS